MSYKDPSAGIGGINSIQQRQIRGSRTFELSGIVVTNDPVKIDDANVANALCELRFEAVPTGINHNNDPEEPEIAMISA